MTYTPIPGFEELQAEFHDAIQALCDGKPDKSDFMIPLERMIRWERVMEPVRRHTIKEVAQAVMIEHGITWDVLISRRKHRNIVRPRQLAMYITRELCPHVSLPQIARFFDRDHTTVTHATRAVDSLIGQDPEFKALYEKVLHRLGVNYVASEEW